MSIASKLQDILDCKDAIKTAIAGKGGTITDATPLDEYAQAIEGIPSGGGSDEDWIRAICGRSLTDIVIPDGVTTIHYYAFVNCTQMTSVSFPNSVTDIKSYAFQNTGISTLVLPPNLTQVSSLSFPNNRNLASITIGNRVTLIGQQAFNACLALTSVNIPDNVTQLLIAAFADIPNLVDMQIGTGIRSIGNLCFRACNNLVLRIYATTPPALGTGVFNAGQYNGKIYVPDASVNDYKTATNWSTWASYIYPLSEYQP